MGEEQFPLDALEGLASRWEGSNVIRQRFRDDGGLMMWPSPDAVGQASMMLDVHHAQNFFCSCLFCVTRGQQRLSNTAGYLCELRLVLVVAMIHRQGLYNCRYLTFCKNITIDTGACLDRVIMMTIVVN